MLNHYNRRSICASGGSDADPNEEEMIRGELDRELNRLTDEADDRYGFKDPNRTSP